MSCRHFLCSPDWPVRERTSPSTLPSPRSPEPRRRSHDVLLQRGRRYLPPVVQPRTGELAAGQEADDHAHGDMQPLGDLAGGEGFNRHLPYRRRLLAGALSPTQQVPIRRLGRDSTRATVPSMVKGTPFAGYRCSAAIYVSSGRPLPDESQATFAAARASRIWREWMQHHVSLVPGPHAGQHSRQK